MQTASEGATAAAAAAAAAEQLCPCFDIPQNVSKCTAKEI